MIPQSFIEDLKYRCPIEDLISSYVPLKKAGNTMKGLCPFHSEKTPSFTVFTQKQSFYCFGCGVGGDVVTFVMKSENLDYISALEFLAKRTGLPFPDDQLQVAQGTSRTRIFEMNKEAAKYFRSMLFESPEGARAREYVSKRQLSGATVKHFGLGYAPESFDSLRNHLRSLGFTYEEMENAFLCKKSAKNNSCYDIFRGRLMFPIIDNSGNVIAFGGRVLDDSQPKYLNTSDTPAFKKMKNLFALNFARNSCAEKLIVCEGYMDVISLHAAGFENSVATLGTAITPEHARMLKKYTKKVILSYDSDGAGQKATDKALRLLSDVGLEASILVMNGAKDPDEYIKKFGKEKFAQIIGESRTPFDYRLETVLREHDITNDSEKIKAAGDIIKYISKVPSKVEREIYVMKASKIFSLSPQSLSADIRREMNKAGKFRDKERREEEMRKMTGFSDRVNRDHAKYPKLCGLEESVIGMILMMREHISHPVDGKIITREDFTSDYSKRIVSFILQKENEGGFDISMLSQDFSEEDASKSYGIMSKRMMLTDNGTKVYEELVREMRTEREKINSSGESIDDITSIIKNKSFQ